ncbi:MAG: DUF4279 domain-containing protein [Fimbriimonadaceae bacterium]|nr:DUF4279 domain-containing protein [Fimbriimonadaceae bacterium]
MPENAEPEFESSEFRLGINTYHDDYPTCRQTYVSLCFRGNADPNSITQSLCIEPVRSSAPGDLSLTGQIRMDSNWVFSSEGLVDSRDTLHHLDWLLQNLNGKDDAINKLQDEGWKACIWVFWDSKSGHGGPTLTPYTMKRLAELSLVLYFDNYYSSDNEE